jgi:hypothetical protein
MTIEVGDPLSILAGTPRALAHLIASVPRARLDAPPAPGKWSATTILAHLADSEIVYGYRLRIMIGANGSAIQATDQDAWATAFSYSTRDPTLSVEDFRVYREGTLRMLGQLSEAQWECHGVHSERGRETVRRVVVFLAVHDTNHIQQIRVALRLA